VSGQNCRCLQQTAQFHQPKSVLLLGARLRLSFSFFASIGKSRFRPFVFLFLSPVHQKETDNYGYCGYYAVPVFKPKLSHVYSPVFSKFYFSCLTLKEYGKKSLKVGSVEN
jgi:hypothetical protein